MFKQKIRDWLSTPELRKKVTSRLLVTLVWLAIITLLRWHWQWNLISFWLGGIAGTFFLDIDHWLYLLVINPQELTSMRVKRLLEQRRFKEALILIGDTTQERIKLPFHNALFQPILYVLCFFVLTSTGSLLGAGLVMVMALHLVKDELACLLRGKEDYLRKRLFWQAEGEVSLKNQKFFVILMLFVFLGLNWLLI